jgi:hypothetical protein
VWQVNRGAVGLSRMRRAEGEQNTEWPMSKKKCNPVVKWDHWRSHKLTGPQCIVQNKDRIQASVAYGKVKGGKLPRLYML